MKMLFCHGLLIFFSTEGEEQPNVPISEKKKDAAIVLKTRTQCFSRTEEQQYIYSILCSIYIYIYMYLQYDMFFW